MGSVGSGSRRVAAREVLGFLEDLDALVDGPGLILHLGRDGGSARVGKGGKPLYHRAGGRAWKRITRRARREILLGWIQGAASIARSRLLV